MVVTNPDGERVTLTGGFSYLLHPPPGTPVTVSLAVTPTSMPTGGQLRVGWTTQAGRSAWDWIGIFRVGDSNFDYLDYQFTDGGASGTQTWTAPSQPGQHEFRYLLDDGYESVARSEAITVGTGATATAAGGSPLTLRRHGRGSSSGRR